MNALRRVAVLVLGGLALTGCTRPPSIVRLDAGTLADGSAVLTVAGPPGTEVAIVAVRPWRGEELIHAGLVGGRGSSAASPADLAAGVGTQAFTVLGDEPFTTTVPAAQLAAWPKPLVLQAVAGQRSAKVTTLTVSNAYRVDGGEGAPTLVPFTLWHGLADAARPFATWVLLPLAAAAALVSLLRRRTRLQWLLPALLAAAAVARLADGAATWPWQTWSAADELVQLERHFGAGLGQVVSTVRSERRGDEPLAVLVDDARTVEHQALAAHLVRLLPGATVTSEPGALPARGLVVVLANTRTAPVVAREAPVLHAPAGRQLLATGVAVLWRVGGD